MALRRDLPIEDEPGLIRHRLGPSKLYLDDVERIYNHLVGASEKKAKESGENKEAAQVKITAGKGTIADLPEDLCEANAEELLEVSVALDWPVVSVDLWRRGAGVTAQSSDPEARELARRIHEHIKSKRSWASVKIVKSPADGGLIALTVVACMAIIAPLTYFIHASHIWLINSLSVVGLFICAVLVRAYFLFLSGTVKVVPRK